MAGGCAWSRRVVVRQRTLRGLVRDTQAALNDVTNILQFEPEIPIAVQEIGNLASRCTALVIFGCTASARARLLHCLLGRQLLPDPPPRGCRWLRIQYGSSTQVHLTLGNSEFELVEELECNKRPWDTIPIEDLVRQDQTDLATMLEIELNNSFLKDGFKIIVPPDLDADPGLVPYTKLKELNPDFYSKRDIILKNFNPIYLYAVDRIGKNVFSENIVCSSSIVTSQSEEDFWTMFNLYSMAQGGVGCEHSKGSVEREQCREERKELSSEPSVFSSENCLDLHQVKDINAKAQVLFVLFSNSVSAESREENRREERLRLQVEATESTEETVFRTDELPESDQELAKDGVLRHTQESLEQSRKDDRRLNEEQVAFMNDLLDQWELMSSPPPKHYAKSQWTIIDDDQIMRTSASKALATYLSAAVQNANETSAKKHKRDDDRRVENRGTFLSQVVKFATECTQSNLLEYSTKLSEIQVKLLQQLILASFDMARELQLVPKRIQYVASQEQQLYETINNKFSEGDKKQELLQIMEDVLQEMRTEIDNMDWSVDDLPWHQDRRFVISNSIFYSSSRNSPDKIPLQISNQNQSSRSSLIDQSADQSLLVDQSADQTPSDGEEAVSYDCYNWDDYEIIHSNDESLSVTESYNKRKQPNAEDASPTSAGAIRVENESEMFSMSSARTWRTDTLATNATDATACTNSLNISVKQASLDVQQTVLSKLSRKISLKLVKFVDCLNEAYFGTLQRCLETLEAGCREELGGRPASEAMRALVSVARTVDLQPCASFSLLRSLADSLRRLFHKLRLARGGAEAACCVLSPVWRRHVAAQTARELTAHRLARVISAQVPNLAGLQESSLPVWCVGRLRLARGGAEAACCVLSPVWRRHVAAHTARELTAHRLARVISAQILERLSVAHERYQSALTSLEAALAGRLHHTEDVKLNIRKKYAPSFARLCLESTSMCDLLMYGTPDLGREIGRGQYGVVYAVRGAWGGRAPVAVKSVLPADERHYRELAMEFFYTRSIPAHPRIVRLHGSIVQRHSGTGPCVLLVSERKVRDLHAAVRAGLSFAKRMRISADIVEGIRYLHSLGLVHRDIKMKNVLLDGHDRASLSDLGFCAAEALISGSVVGTPVHMAPELLAGEYDAAVDVYAFGILFWYVCAGNIKLPSAFETFQNKEQLWSKVKRGLRPERLPQFYDECWEIMESCWASEPSQRALLGDVQPRLERLLEQALARGDVSERAPRSDGESDEDSLYMTGIPPLGAQP